MTARKVIATLAGALLALAAAGCLVEADEETAVYDYDESEMELDAEPLGDPNEGAEPDPEPWHAGRVGSTQSQNDPGGTPKLTKPKIGPVTPGSDGSDGSDGEGSGSHD